MNRLLLFTVLLIACLAPAFGAPTKKNTHVAPHSERLSNALGGFNRGDPMIPIGSRVCPTTEAGAPAPVAGNSRSNQPKDD